MFTSERITGNNLKVNIPTWYYTVCNFSGILQLFHLRPLAMQCRVCLDEVASCPKYQQQVSLQVQNVYVQRNTGEPAGR